MEEIPKFCENLGQLFGKVCTPNVIRFDFDFDLDKIYAYKASR